MEQVLVIADVTATTWLTIWENEIGSLESNTLYILKGVTVHQFCGKQFLSTTKDILCIIKTEDIGEVIEENNEDIEPLPSLNTFTIKNAKVIGILDMQTYSSCVRCKSKVHEDDDDETLCICTKCKMTQTKDSANTQLSIRVVVKSPTTEVVLRAFGNTISDILQQPDIDHAEITKGMLLKADPFSLTYSEGIIQSIRKI